MRVAQLELEVKHVARIAIQLLRQKLKEDRVVAARRALLGAFRVWGCGGRIGGGRRGRRTGTQRCLHGVSNDGRHVALEVHFESIVERPIEVDGEARDAHDGAVHLDELMREFGFNAIASTAHENASGDAEVAVEPRVPEASTIVLHAHLQEVGGGRLGVGLQAGAGGIGVRADDHEPVAGAVFGADGERAHRAHVASEEVLPPGLEVVPRVTLGDFLPCGKKKRGQG